MSTYNDRTYADARDEIAAYDVLEMLMKLHGARAALDVLRYWYVVSSLNGGRRGGNSAADGRKRETR